jgi:uncharacterized membrane protein required for colicin V production
MIWLDWLILGILGYNVVSGLFSGFFRSLINLVALVAAYLLTPVLKGFLAVLVQTSFQMPPYLALPLGTFLAWTLIYVVISVVGLIVSKLVNMTPLMLVDRLAGVGFGLLVSAILILVPLAGIQSLPFLQKLQPLQQTLKSSMMVQILQPGVSFVQSTAGPAILNYWFKSQDQNTMKQAVPSASPSAAKTPARPSARPVPKATKTTGR